MWFQQQASQRRSSSQRMRDSQQFSSSQASQSHQGHRSSQAPNSQVLESQDLNHYDLDRMVTEVVQYLLISEQKRLPVKKADITKLIGLRGSQSKNFKAIMTAAGKFLEQV